MAVFDGSIAYTLDKLKGYHFSSTTRFQGRTHPGCLLCLTYSFPRDVFVDPFELQYDWSHPFHLLPQPNLEHPVGVEDTNSTLIVHIRELDTLEDGLIVALPIHARYAQSVSREQAGYHDVSLVAPTAHWVCSSPVSSPLSVTPMSEQSLGVVKVQIPMGNLNDLPVVEPLTVAIIWCLLLYVLTAFGSTFKHINQRAENNKHQ